MVGENLFSDVHRQLIAWNELLTTTATVNLLSTTWTTAQVAMATGVVAFALQLVLAKLIVLAKAGFSITEILSDALGLFISVVGLVLTTQAAAENSSFTQSPAAVLSASAVGIVFGLIFFWWGQSQEIRAVRGRKSESVKP